MVRLLLRISRQCIGDGGGGAAWRRQHSLVGVTGSRAAWQRLYKTSSEDHAKSATQSARSTQPPADSAAVPSKIIDKPATPTAAASFDGGTPSPHSPSPSTGGASSPTATPSPSGDKAAATSPTTATTPPAPAAAPKSAGKTKLSRKMVKQNVNRYVFTRYFDYVKNYDRVLEKNFPSAVKVYRVFFDGVKEFFADMKRFWKITGIVNSSPQGLRSLNRKELELYMQMPRDMVKVAPALIGSSLPMVGYAIFPLVFMYPRTFLTTHFWTLQQRSEFQQLHLQERLRHNRAALRCLQAKLGASHKSEKHEEFKSILGLLGSGFHPHVELLLESKEIFTKPPYSLLSLSGKHVKALHNMHGLPGSWFRRHRLREHAFLIHYMDLAITREGGVHNMHVDAMRYACHLRGLNPVNLRNEEMIDWLRNWIRVSMAVREEHISLFLHLPLFLGYNHPNNWKIIYESK